MELLRSLLDTDGASPRLTVYNEASGSRLDFSAETLDNWAAKVANMLIEEFDLEPGTGSLIGIDLPGTWQAAVLALGALAAGVDYRIGRPDGAEVQFSMYRDDGADLDEDFEADLCLVTDDPFGRGVTEIGGELPAGAVDFGPTVRVYGDQFTHPTPRLVDKVTTELPANVRALSTGWTDTQTFTAAVLEPLAANGSAVIVAGLVGTDRLDVITATEKADLRL